VNNISSQNAGISACLKGVLRVLGIILSVIILAPLQYIVLVSRRGDPFFFARLFHKITLRILGFKVRVHGEICAKAPVLYVSNHSSYLDITVLGSLLRASFISKAEVNDWPIFGALSRLQRTAFIERRAAYTAEQRDVMLQRFLKGDSLVLFAEGTSSSGQRVLPFKSSLFSAAETPLADGSPLPVQPVTIVFTELGGLPAGRTWRPYYSWFGDMTLLPHLWRVLKSDGFTVDVVFYPPVTIRGFPGRKELAEYCHRLIAVGVEKLLAGRHVSVP